MDQLNAKMRFSKAHQLFVKIQEANDDGSLAAGQIPGSLLLAVDSNAAAWNLQRELVRRGYAKPGPHNKPASPKKFQTIESAPTPISPKRSRERLQRRGWFDEGSSNSASIEKYERALLPKPVSLAGSGSCYDRTFQMEENLPAAAVLFQQISLVLKPQASRENAYLIRPSTQNITPVPPKTETYGGERSTRKTYGAKVGSSAASVDSKKKKKKRKKSCQ